MSERALVHSLHLSASFRFKEKVVMLNRQILAGLALTLAFTTAHAAENTSEFFYQTGAGKSDVTGQIGYTALNRTGKGQTTDYKVTGLAPIGVAYEYGLSEMLSVEGILAYGSLEDNSTPSRKSTGLVDPMVTLKGTQKMDFGHLRFGATLGLGGISKSKTESNGDTNLLSGGYSLKPYIGADLNAGPGILGARLSYNYKLDRTSDNNGTEGTTKGGNETDLSAFYEYMLSDMVLGAELNYTMTAETKDKNDQKLNNAANKTGASLYGRIPAIEKLAIIPRLDYVFSNSDTDTYDKYNDMILSVAARYEF
jgi:hypothetical protein